MFPLLLHQLSDMTGRDTWLSESRPQWGIPQSLPLSTQQAADSGIEKGVLGEGGVACTPSEQHAASRTSIEPAPAC